MCPIDKGRIMKKVFLALWILICPLLAMAEGLGPLLTIDTAESIQSGIYPSYNSQRDQYLLTWWDLNEDNVTFSICNSDGTVAVPTTVLFDTEIVPFSDITSCYNPHANEYFVVFSNFNTSSASFCRLSPDGTVLQSVTAIPGTHAPDNNVYCCFNSADHQYFVTWEDSSLAMFFAIVNEDGTVAISETLLAAAPDTSALGLSFYGCYNASTNQYLVSWTGSDFTAYFAIIAANGTMVMDATAISDSVGYNNGCNCYNSVNNEYFLTWIDSSGNTYFCVLNDVGGVVIAPQLISEFNSDRMAGISCSYNSIDNEYFLTAVNPPDARTGTIYAILSDAGGVVHAPAVIENTDGLQTMGSAFNAYGSTTNRTLISWAANNVSEAIGYYTLYSKDLPPDVVPSPSDLWGMQMNGRVEFDTQFVYTLRWDPSPGMNIVRYNIYVDGEYIDFVSASQVPKFLYCTVQINARYVFSVTAVDAEGNESFATSVVVEGS